MALKRHCPINKSTYICMNIYVSSTPTDRISSLRSRSACDSPGSAIKAGLVQHHTSQVSIDRTSVTGASMEHTIAEQGKPVPGASRGAFDDTTGKWCLGPEWVAPSATLGLPLYSRRVIIHETHASPLL